MLPFYNSIFNVFSSVKKRDRLCGTTPSPPFLLRRRRFARWYFSFLETMFDLFVAGPFNQDPLGVEYAELFFCGRVAMWRCGVVAMWRCGDLDVSFDWR